MRRARRGGQALLSIGLPLLLVITAAAAAAAAATTATTAGRRLLVGGGGGGGSRSTSCIGRAGLAFIVGSGRSYSAQARRLPAGAIGFQSRHPLQRPSFWQALAPSHRRFAAAAAAAAAAATEQSAAPTKQQPQQQGKRSAWGQRVVPLGPEAVGTDITEELLRRGLPELPDIREGVAFFHLQAEGPWAEALGLEIGAGARARNVAVSIQDGQLVLAGSSTATNASPRVRLTGAGATMEPSSAGGTSVAVAVTWNGDKVRAGSSHRCEVREAEVSGPRKEALDKALAELGVDIQELTEEEQLTGSGSSALRSYFSFVQPRPGKQHGPVDNALDLAANRAANQIAFLVRAYRAEQAEYLRNHDEAMSTLKARNLTMHPVKLLLDNVRSAFNVGSLFRTAETALVAEIVTAGFTPHPPHAKLAKTACRSIENVPTRHFATTLEAVKALKQEGYAIYAMETTSRSECYTQVEFPRKVCLILGNEVIGVDTAVMELCDRIVEIPTFGQKNSLNVASAAPVVVYEVLRQWGCMDAEQLQQRRQEQEQLGKAEGDA